MAVILRKPYVRWAFVAASKVGEQYGLGLLGRIDGFHTAKCTLATNDALKSRSRWSVVTDNGSTVVCWHPEQPFPYEVSKPMPNPEEEINEGDSILKVQFRYADKYRFRPDGPTNEELQRMTFTTKHQWYPTSGRKYRKPNPPRNREGL